MIALRTRVFRRDERRCRSIREALATLIAVVAMAGTLGGCEEHDDDDDDAPPITADRVRPHEHKGECTDCHRVLGSDQGFRGAPGRGRAPRAAPAITFNDVRPHPDRGACVGCHSITSARQ